jgi:hypothetical protein
MPSDFIPAKALARREYIAAKESLVIKHAAVSPLLCGAFDEPDDLAEFPAVLISR